MSALMLLFPGVSSVPLSTDEVSSLMPGVIRVLTNAPVGSALVAGVGATTLFADSSGLAEASNMQRPSPSLSPLSKNASGDPSNSDSDQRPKATPTVVPSSTMNGKGDGDNSCDDRGSEGYAKTSSTATATATPGNRDNRSDSRIGNGARLSSNYGLGQSSKASLTNVRTLSTTIGSISNQPCGDKDPDDQATPTTITYPFGWGENDMGQVGDGTTIQRSTPITLTALTTVTMIEAGTEHALGLRSDGTVEAWGKNSNGQIGAPTSGTCSQPYNPNPIPCTLTPAEVVGPGGNGFLSGITQVAGGEYDSVALKNDGTVWTWGGSSNSSVPIQVSGLSNVVAVAMQGFTGYALKSDGTVWAWGKNRDGELGDGSTTNSSTPVQVRGLTGVTAIAAGESNGVALKSDGSVWAWGMGLIWGSYSVPDQLTPAQLPGFSGITAIAAGFEHVTALKSDGTVWTIGINGYGELGNSTVTSTATAIQVQTPAGTPLTGVQAIAGGYWNTLALLSNQTVVAWGDNSFGELGVATTDVCGGSPCSQTAIPVAGLSNVIRVGIGEYNGFALIQQTSSSSTVGDCTCKNVDSCSGD
ncbi:MAG TPA: hypothetical protein VMW65_15715, partial [Chloroflexota bacterium]|nr:hypothetical protein [Chloroflexota bacterium]